MPVFEITTPSTNVALRAPPGQPFTGQASFKVVNRMGRDAKVRGLVSVDPPAKQEWFSVSGEQQVANGASATFNVRMVLPAGTPLATYQFKPVAAAVDDPSNSSATGPEISVTLAAQQPPPKWLVPVIVAGVLVVLAGAGFVIYKIINGGPKPPEPACRQDADCKGEANKCVDGNCVKPKAGVGQDCRQDGDCVTNKCIRFACAPEDVCLEARHCVAPKVCIDGRCRLKPSGTACSAAPECASGRCLRGTCREVNDCDSAADCGANLACWQKHCQQGPIGANCRGDGDCQSRHCQPGPQACVECLVTAHCGRGVCAGGACRPLPRGARCTRSQDCASNQCIALPLQPTRICM